MLQINKLQPITNWLHNNGWIFYKHQLEVLEYSVKNFDVLLIAPTGGGKTLGGFLPSIYDLSDKKKECKLHTLYISPLKALAVDVHRNLIKPITEQGMNISVETRTGDTSYLKRKRQKNNPPDMLMTTPESFALMMSDSNSEIYFKKLKYIIIDEIHSLINTKRGDLLALNLARIESFLPNCKRICLSATIKNKKNALNFFSRKNKGKIISVKEKTKPEIKILDASQRIPWSGHLANYAVNDIYKKILQFSPSIIFVNTRAQSELIFQNLWRENEKKLKIALHHGSLDKEIRRKVENQMSLGLLDCVVATSSLDLGIDWGNVKLIIQVGSPKQISRFLQRIGRSNHSLNTPSKAILVPSNRFEYLECLAVINSINKNIIDSEQDKIGGLDVLAQHILGVACSKPFDPNILFINIKKAWPYRHLKKKEYLSVLEFVKNGGYTLKKYEKFSKIGLNQDNLYMVKNKNIRNSYKLNIGTIVESYMLKVKLGNKNLGAIEEWFVEGLTDGDTFIFGGQVLEFKKVFENIVYVNKTISKTPKIPSYAGGRLPLSSTLSDNVKDLLNNQKIWNHFPEQISYWLKLQLKNSKIPSKEDLLIETFPKKIKKKIRFFLVAYTFEGRNTNQTLGFLISRRMNRLDLKPLGFVATEYALAIWSMKEVSNVNDLFAEELMLFDLYEWLEETPLLKKNFRDAAVISCMIEKKTNGKLKTGKQIIFSTDLIFDVLKKYEPNHLLMKIAKTDSMRGLIDLDRLGRFLKRINNKVILKKLDKISPMAVPLILEINKETINKEEVNEFYLEEFENDTLREAGL